MVGEISASQRHGHLFSFTSNLAANCWTWKLLYSARKWQILGKGRTGGAHHRSWICWTQAQESFEAHPRFVANWSGIICEGPLQSGVLCNNRSYGKVTSQLVQFWRTKTAKVNWLFDCSGNRKTWETENAGKFLQKGCAHWCFVTWIPAVCLQPTKCRSTAKRCPPSVFAHGWIRPVQNLSKRRSSIPYCPHIASHIVILRTLLLSPQVCKKQPAANDVWISPAGSHAAGGWGWVN